MDCIFCKIVSGDIQGKIIFRNDQVIVILSLEGHPLVIPVEHIENIYTLDDQTAAALMIETVRVSKAVKTALQADGINIVQSNEAAAGQEVMHLHIHIKPRFKNDGVNLQSLNNKVDDKKETIVERIQQALETNK